MKKVSLLLLLCVVAVMAPAAMADMIIDDFNTFTVQPAIHTVNGVTFQTPWTDGPAAAGVLGGSRDGAVFENANPGSGNQVQATGVVPPGRLDVQSSSGAWMGLILEYDGGGGIGGGGPGLGGVDISMGGTAKLLSVLLDAPSDLPNLNDDPSDVLAMTLIDVNGQAATVDICKDLGICPTPGANLTPTMISWPLVAFTAKNPALDWTQINLIRFEIQNFVPMGAPDTARSLPIDAIATTPEPATIVLGLLTGVAGLIMRRRIRREEGE